MLRGGSWNNNPRNCRSANRNRNNVDNRNNNLGFRLVCSSPSTLHRQSQWMGIHWECLEESRPVPVMTLAFIADWHC
ncbi:MAG: SUMF1/EgtB/PvdO family nonheme iron enzyme [Leptolyngbyaceae bacterium]|nr:SUMF1/EgtB/PvdO family nonheme iron enzyme [Leptolyngbyaceae bacterium]